MQEQQQALTEGQITMNVQFNPDQRKDVKAVKDLCAHLWDYIEKVSRDRSQSPDVITDSVRVSRMMRLAAVAKTHLETFQMLAVEAFTEIEDLSHIEGPQFNKPTPGERYMKADFNKATGVVSEYITEIKGKCAELMDYCNGQAIRTGKWLQTKSNLKVSGEEMTIAERKVSDMATTLREAYSTLRLVRMYAVKAVTR